VRRWLGFGVVAVGIVVLCLPFKYTLPSLANPDKVLGSVDCVPIRDALRQPPREGLYLTENSSLPRDLCVPTARRRAVVGGMSLVAGTGSCGGSVGVVGSSVLRRATALEFTQTCLRRLGFLSGWRSLTNSPTTSAPWGPTSNRPGARGGCEDCAELLRRQGGAARSGRNLNA
jgi:hypothetical protein